MSSREIRIGELRRQRPTSLFLRLNAVCLLVLSLAAWWQLDIQWSDFFSEHGTRNLRRFADDIFPFALRDKPFELVAVCRWCADIWIERGRVAMAATLGISVVAMILAGCAALLCVFPASRNWATPEPFLPGGQPSSARQRLSWRSLVGIVRGLFILVRSIPEYIWAFLLLAMLGVSVWPAILALAIHNFGILGKLGAEVVENADVASLRALRAQGLSRTQIAAFGIVPTSLPKWLLFFFYRWETCIREATVLGMLGISSLGFWIIESRARDKYDEMLLFVLMGAALVLVVDLASALTRFYLRRA